MVKLFFTKSIAPDAALIAILSIVGSDLDKIILICFETMYFSFILIYFNSSFNCKTY